MENDKVRVALAGLGYGARFIPIWQRHPQAELIAICRRSRQCLDQLGDMFGIERRYDDFLQILDDPGIDCVHINTPIGDHGWMTIAALQAGKHVLCAVPMALSIEECERICGLADAGSLIYMMAETAIFTREYLFLKELHGKGEFGELQYLQASHTQNMAGWPEYWEHLAPMHYATHAAGPVLDLAGGRAESVSCLGSGRVRENIHKKSGTPHAVESCHIRIRGCNAAAHIWRFLHDTARQYREGIQVYGSKKSFEWSLIEGEPHILHSAGKPEPEIPETVDVPDYAHLLPAPIREFTRPNPKAPYFPLVRTGGGGGSHPHLVNEFIQAVCRHRDPRPNAAAGANWTCVGLCAHHSAMAGGEFMSLPAFTLKETE